MPGPAQKGPLIRYAGSAAETSIGSTPVGDELGEKSIPRGVSVKRTHTGTAALQRSAEHARPRDAVTGDDLPQRARASAPLVHGRGIPPGPAGQTRILYRVVDGYDGDTLTARRTRSSKRPLTRGELIVLLAARPLQEVLEGTRSIGTGRRTSRGRHRRSIRSSRRRHAR